MKSVSRLFSSLSQLPSLLLRRNSVYSYKPTFYLSHPLLQIVYNALQPKSYLPYQTELVFFEDGGHATLNWSQCPVSIANHSHPSDRVPIVFIMHGLTGGSDENYIKSIVEQASLNGFRAVCLNSRGVGIEMTSPQPFTSLTFEDLDQCIDLIQKRHPNSPIYMVGASFGANYITRYLIFHPHRNIQGYVALAAPFNIPVVVRNMGLFYQKYFIKSYIQEFIRKHPIMNHWGERGLVDMDRVYRSENLHQFHQSITVKITKEKSIHTLYQKLSIGDQIQRLDVPTLFIYAKDDPIVTTEGTPKQAIKRNRNISWLQTEKGGHICWFQGLRPKRWYPKPTIAFLKSLHQNKYSRLP